MQAHVSRMTECGISGGTPLAMHSARGPAGVGVGVGPPRCQPSRKMGVALVLVTGGGAFYNFYSEDAMGTMVKRARANARAANRGGVKNTA